LKRVEALEDTIQRQHNHIKYLERLAEEVGSSLLLVARINPCLLGYSPQFLNHRTEREDQQLD
jgi:hypothetical protein